MEIVANNIELLFIRVTRTEGLKLIKSLSDQMLNNNPNVGRDETFTDKGVDVSISVEPEKKDNCPLYIDYKKDCQALKDHELSRQGIDPRSIRDF